MEKFYLRLALVLVVMCCASEVKCQSNEIEEIPFQFFGRNRENIRRILNALCDRRCRPTCSIRRQEALPCTSGVCRCTPATTSEY